MKRLLVLMMCAMLAVPAVAMDVQAEENTGIEAQTDGEEDADPNSPENLKKAAIVAVKTINDTYEISDFSNTEKNKADAVMKKAASKLGVAVADTGKLDENTFDASKMTLSTSGMIEKYAEQMIAELKACKTKEPVKETPKEPEKIDVNSTIIIGSALLTGH